MNESVKRIGHLKFAYQNNRTCVHHLPPSSSELFDNHGSSTLQRDILNSATEKLHLKRTTTMVIYHIENKLDQPCHRWSLARLHIQARRTASIENVKVLPSLKSSDNNLLYEILYYNELKIEGVLQLNFVAITLYFSCWSSQLNESINQSLLKKKKNEWLQRLPNLPPTHSNIEHCHKMKRTSSLSWSMNLIPVVQVLIVNNSGS